ncbi:MAG: DUF5394 family protein [Alphaproteobacteria bacterium]|jgi:hypothetical protein|nr:DUF5394 family protein [Candidatus Jidaibacter sp.]
MSNFDQSSSGNNKQNLSQEDVIKLLNLAYELKKALRVGDSFKIERISKDINLLYLLLEYLIANIDNPAIDTAIIAFLLEYLGKAKKKDLEFEAEDEMDKAEFEKMMRWVIYEIYKTITPRQIAGETPVENFVANVKNLGIEEALRQEGNGFIKAEVMKDLKQIEIQKPTFAELVKQAVKHHDQGMSH